MLQCHSMNLKQKKLNDKKFSAVAKATPKWRVTPNRMKASFANPKTAISKIKETIIPRKKKRKPLKVNTAAKAPNAEEATEAQKAKGTAETQQVKKTAIIAASLKTAACRQHG